jgi:hypothetical protein
MTMEYTPDEYSDMTLTLCTWNSGVCTAARDYAVRYTGRRHPHANVFRSVEQCLRETAHVNARVPRTVRPWRCHNCSCESRAVEKFTPCCMRIGTIRTEGHRITSWKSIESIPPLAESTSFYQRLSSTDTILRTATAPTQCGWALRT